ncbi:MAG: hypothetical protein RLZZ08_1476, partial [Pseudomonadota bacterium]
MPQGGRPGLAVSGGADSMAMLLLAAEAIPGGFEVATVDHGLRAEAAGECALVQRVCADRGISCAVLPVLVAQGNVQAQARAARYAALAQWAQDRGLAAIATAHQADDQVETVLMRLARGSGVAGLAGIRAGGVVPDTTLPLVRPMLGFTRQTCEQIVAAAAIDWVRDPSNTDDHYDRVRLRKALSLNTFAQQALVSPDAIAATAAHCADADAALDWAAQREWDERVICDDGLVRYRPQAPRAVAMRIVTRAVQELGGAIRGAQAADIADALQGGCSANAGGVLARCT